MTILSEKQEGKDEEIKTVGVISNLFTVIVTSGVQYKKIFAYRCEKIKLMISS